MIESMKKFSMLVYHAEYQHFLEELGNLGVLHVEMGESELSTENSAKIAKINHIRSLLNDLDGKASETKGTTFEFGGEELISLLDAKNEEAGRLSQDISFLEKEKDSILPWGDFNPDTIKGLNDAGYNLQFLISDVKNWDEAWNEEFDVELINQVKTELYLLVVNKGDRRFENPNVEEVSLIHPVSYYEKEIGIKTEKMSDVDGSFNQLAEYATGVLNSYIVQLENEIDFSRVHNSGEKVADDKLIVLTGWVPLAQEESFSKSLDDQGVIYTIDDPTTDDVMPIKLKNNRFSRLFEVIGELYTLPNHKELDLTPFFAPFYMLFFGFCLGDAGYGLLMVLGTLIGLKKAKPKIKPLLWLGFYLGISTTIMGILGGTFFGVMFGMNATTGEPNYNIPWLYKYQQYVLDTNNLMVLSLLLGYVQVIFGMILKAVNISKMHGARYALAQIGWIVIVAVTIPFYALGMQGMMDVSLANEISLISGIIGAIPAIFYNTPGKNVLLNFGTGLWDTYGMASGLLGDVLSYIRLFALGLSSAILGSVFNSLAMSLSPDIILVKQIVMLLILAFGHSLNLFMALLGSFVHPLRLTFVEFYKNAGFEGGGQSYNPFTTK